MCKTQKEIQGRPNVSANSTHNFGSAIHFNIRVSKDCKGITNETCSVKRGLNVFPKSFGLWQPAQQAFAPF